MLQVFSGNTSCIKILLSDTKILYNLHGDNQIQTDAIFIMDYSAAKKTLHIHNSQNGLKKRRRQNR